jgi:hypothetical protein
VKATSTKTGIVEWASRSASARALEMQLAAKLGGWVPRAEPAGAKLLLARHARHHAWHTELWDDVVPVLHDQPGRIGVDEPALREAAGLLAAAQDPLGVYDDVLPHVVAAYRSWSAEATPVAERPIMRVLDLVLRDLDFDAREGHDLFARR